MILMAEEKFAREVTLGVIVTRPLSVWRNIIPGMFIFDFLSREGALRKYTEYFLFPRKLAIDAIQALARGEEKTAVFSHIEQETTGWLNSLKLHTPGLLQAQLAVTKLLVDHYAKLIEEDGYSVYALIKKAYNRVNFEGFIKELTTAEAEVDRKRLAKMGGTEKLRAKIEAEQKQIKERREKIIEEVF